MPAVLHRLLAAGFAAGLAAVSPAGLVSVAGLLPAQDPLPRASVDRIYGKRVSRHRSTAARARRPGIEAGLEWLANARGTAVDWRDAAVGRSTDAAVAEAGLVVLAFLADGSTMRSGPHRKEVTEGIRWLREQQSESGAFAERTGPHLLATLAMVEVYRLSAYRLLKKNAQRSVNHLATLRHEDGGWRATPHDTVSAPSLIVWGTMALGTAIDANLAVAPDARAGVRRWLAGPRAGALPETSVFGTPVPAARLHEIVFEQAIANAFTRAWLEAIDDRDAAIVAARARPTTWTPSPEQRLSLVERLFAALTFAQLADHEAVDAVLAGVLAAQVRDADDAGSWDAIGVHGGTLGRVGTTALALLVLTADQRYAARVASTLPAVEPDGRDADEDRGR